MLLVEGVLNFGPLADKVMNYRKNQPFFRSNGRKKMHLKRIALSFFDPKNPVESASVSRR